MIDRPQLLVSIRAASELDEAVRGGADIVDVKNTNEGSLGAPSLDLLRAARAAVRSPTLLSVALGDAPHLPGSFGLAAAGAAAFEPDFVKVGLLGSDTPALALELLSAVCRGAAATSGSCRVVAVAYADSTRAGGLPPAELPAVARDAGAIGVMLDTAVKDGASLFAAMSAPTVRDFAASAKRAGLLVALAGSLTSDDFARAADLGADIIGVRGAACVGGRSGTVNAARVAALKAALAARGHTLATS